MNSSARLAVTVLAIIRISAMFLLMVLLLLKPVAFKWLLTCSLLLEIIELFMSRNIQGRSRSLLSVIANEGTLLVVATGIILLKRDFITENIVAIGTLIVLVLGQNAMAKWKYGKLQAFETYLSRIAMLMQLIFIVALFFTSVVPYWLFYPTVVVTVADVIEEILLVYLLPEAAADVKGLYWVLKYKRDRTVD